MENFDQLKLKNQICFPLYACSREIIKKYTPFLDALDLTYTQYITMMVLWEKGTVTSKELGSTLCLDSGTLTPLLKKMESKGLLTRKRSAEDERVLIVSITDKGEQLKEQAASVPANISRCAPLDPDEAKQLYALLYKMLGALKDNE